MPAARYKQERISLPRLWETKEPVSTNTVRKKDELKTRITSTTLSFFLLKRKGDLLKMCEFVSWIEYQKEILFLTQREMETKRGRELKKYLGVQFEQDKTGHGAIELYFDLRPSSGIHRECVDFSDPHKLPEEIVEAVKDGSFRNFAVPKNILADQAVRSVHKIERAAYAKFRKVEFHAMVEYGKILKSADFRCEAYAEILCRARSEQNKIQDPAYAEYSATVAHAFWNVAKDPKNRRSVWR
jgi:hypothetical protein